LFLGLAAMVLASVFYFAYSAAMHHSRTELATCLLELDVDRARAVGGFKGGVALENVWYFHVGNVLFLLGGISLTGVVGLLLI
jgi:hypothetical protein